MKRTHTGTALAAGLTLCVGMYHSVAGEILAGI